MLGLELNDLGGDRRREIAEGFANNFGSVDGFAHLHDFRSANGSVGMVAKDVSGNE